MLDPAGQHGLVFAFIVGGNNKQTAGNAAKRPANGVQMFSDRFIAGIVMFHLAILGVEQGVPKVPGRGNSEGNREPLFLF